MDRWMNGWRDRWMDRWMNGWIGGWINRRRTWINCTILSHTRIVWCRVSRNGNKGLIIYSENPLRAVTPGQVNQ